MSTKSYKEQYKRMKRWYNRLKAIYTGMEHKVSDEYYNDNVYAFFQNCYHLKDWLKNDPNLQRLLPDIGTLVEDFANRGPDCIQVCGDLCNGSKHMIISTPKIDANTHLGGRKLRFDFGTHVLAIEYKIECRDQSHDALCLAESCISEWDDFMTRHNIPIP